MLKRKLRSMAPEMTDVTVYIASGNGHKVAEFQAMAAASGLAWRILGADAAGGMPDVEESAATFAGNAAIKAEALAARVPAGSWVLADDSGVAVDALGGRPGVHSARYAGPGATDAANRARLLAELAGSLRPWTAAFVSVLHLIGPSGGPVVAEGRCPGVIMDCERGAGGFGYDSLFVPDGEERTFAELSPAEKDRISHRGNAWAELVRKVAGIVGKPNHEGTKGEKE
jgi:XTP/dITP diphosphohydrolase